MKKTSFWIALVTLSVLAKPVPSQAGLVFFGAPLVIGDTGEQSIGYAVLLWPAGLALTVTGIVLALNGHQTGGYISIGLGEETQNTLSTLYPEIGDREVYRNLALEIEKQAATTPEQVDEATGKSFRYVTIPKERLVSILDSTGIVESGVGMKLIRDLSE